MSRNVAAFSCCTEFLYLYLVSSSVQLSIGSVYLKPLELYIRLVTTHIVRRNMDSL